MSQILKRCPACRRPCLVVEGGTVYPVGGTRIIETAPERIRAVCACGNSMEWIVAGVPRSLR